MQSTVCSLLSKSAAYWDATCVGRVPDMQLCLIYACHNASKEKIPSWFGIENLAESLGSISISISNQIGERVWLACRLATGAWNLTTGAFMKGWMLQVCPALPTMSPVPLELQTWLGTWQPPLLLLL